MSTEATGDGQSDAVGAVEPEVAAEDAGTSATVVAEATAATATVTAAAVTGAGIAGPASAAPTAWDRAPSAWGEPEPAEPDAGETALLVPSQAAAVDETAAAGDPVPDQMPAPAEAAPDEDEPPVTPSPGTEDAAPDSAEAVPEAGETPEAGEASETGETPKAGEASGAGGAVAAQEAAPAGGSARDAEASELAGAGELREPAELDELDEPDELDRLDEPDEIDDPDDLDEPDEIDDPDDLDEPGLDDEFYDGESGEPDEEYDDYADGEAVEYYETYQEDDEPEEAVAPPRARRWPRVLLALGFVVLAAVIVGGAVAIVGSVTHGFKKPVKVTYTKSALFNLKTGECFDPQGQSYSLVSCDSPHVAEVFATFKLSGSKWPGATAVAADASSGCATRLTGYLNPQLAISLSSTYVYPDSVAWQAGTRTVICEVRATSGELTGSVRGASATAG